MTGKFTIADGVLEKYEGEDKEIVIPDGVTCIGDFAFMDCMHLTSITIPESVTEIGEDTFKGCDNLTIHASASSCAEEYTKKNNIKFETI